MSPNPLNREMLDSMPAFHDMVGESPVMELLFRHIHRVARTDVTVLVTGESGTGKELVARALHESSARCGKPFIALNCSALSAELVESELFGHVRGAFTGAVANHDGLFQAAHTGTLFLDEIGDLALPAQAKLLRALENGEILSVGSTKVAKVDVRVIAATNRRLEEMVEAGTFREDLLYRLKVVRLCVPPLRDRKQDIPLLAAHFLEALDLAGSFPRQLDESARQLLLEYEWPGNIRELKNALAAAAIVAEDEAFIGASDLLPGIGPVGHRKSSANIELRTRPPDVATTLASKAGERQSQFPLESLHLPFAEARENALREFDRFFLSAALERNAGNVARTARSLGIHRQSLQKLMTRRGLKSPRERAEATTANQ